MIEWDLSLFRTLYGGEHGALAPVMIALTLLGGGWLSLCLVPLAWAARTRKLATVLGGAIAAQAVAVWLIKRAVGRVRPWIALGLPAPPGHLHDGSFPSGHAAGSFCVAAFLVVVLPSLFPSSAGRARALGALSVVVAGLVALSRVYLAAHFPSDVGGGAIVGGVIGLQAGRLYVRSNDEREKTR
jgi:undecaprenyl-diphosphatase